MKKYKLILMLAVILCALVVMINVHKMNSVSIELFMSEIEALANDESSDTTICTARKACDMNGSFVECKGYQKCEVGFASVTCDGKKHTC